ncbi:light-harvesting protein [Halorhodospira neutriphila]|uniref:Light-harvesting protein n=2 Tax=Halorhodospira neutriphila TaxID=168379 RepID=A0ABS1E6S4_9GAMM|nr:light-harvesting protein [Halorhodospira neutriphila]
MGQQSDDPERVWPSGLTEPEAQELHAYVLNGTLIFFAIAFIAHVLAYINTPWLG